MSAIGCLLVDRLGVDPEEAARRIASLSDEEVQQIAGRLDELPAGEGFVGVVIGAALIIFLVLLITDGLDRDGGDGLARAMERLHKSCRRLIWLNPLLRYAGYEPRTLGAQAMDPHVDDLRPVHNLASLADLAEVLGRPAGPRRRAAA